MTEQEIINKIKEVVEEWEEIEQELAELGEENPQADVIWSRFITYRRCIRDIESIIEEHEEDKSWSEIWSNGPL